jgi:hypothetical protein
MTVEYVLLVAMFAYFLMGAMTSTPIKTFGDYGPRLGARVEKQLLTGDGFAAQGQKPVKWKE